MSPTILPSINLERRNDDGAPPCQINLKNRKAILYCGGGMTRTLQTLSFSPGPLPPGGDGGDPCTPSLADAGAKTESLRSPGRADGIREPSGHCHSQEGHAAKISWDAMSSEQKQDAVLPLFERGESYAFIQNQLGAPSRSAVAGVISRLRQRSGAVKRPVMMRPPAARSKPGRPSKKPEPKPRIEAVAPTIKMAPAPIVEPDPVPVEPFPNGGVTLMELTGRSCRCPSGDPKNDDFRFCGADTGFRGSYCDVHAVRAFEGRRQAALAAADADTP